MQYHVSSYQRPFVKILKVYLLNIGGKETQVKSGYIIMLAKWGFRDWPKCEWNYLCRGKLEGGLGFRDMSKFNIIMLAK